MKIGLNVLVLSLLVLAGCKDPPKYGYEATAASKTYCGDGECKEGEDCASCVVDCGCPEGTFCTDGECSCVPDCTGKDCGSDGCGGSCGQCDDGVFCTEDSCEDGACVFPSKEGSCAGGDGLCLEGACCIPNCGNKKCGPDGCGGICGACIENAECVDDGKCSCPGESCGPVCCPAGEVCAGEECCTPSCNGKECGDDGCGGSCGSCTGKLECVDGECAGTLSCKDLQGCLSACGTSACQQECQASASNESNQQLEDVYDCLSDECGDCDEASCQFVCLGEQCPVAYEDCFHPVKNCPETIECVKECPVWDSDCRALCYFDTKVHDMAVFVHLMDCVDQDCSAYHIGSCFESIIEDDCAGAYDNCLSGCLIECEDNECGADGCGGVCGSCEDDNPCTQTSCGPDNMCVVTPTSGFLCDDGDSCTAEDHCQDGECVGGALACELNCDDGVDDDGDGKEDCEDEECFDEAVCIICGDGDCHESEDVELCPMDCIEDLPEAGDLVITEILLFSWMFEEGGQWFELYNASAASVNLQGCIISNKGGSSHVISPAQPFVVEPGELKLFAPDKGAEFNELFGQDYTYGGLWLGLVLGKLELSLPDGSLLDAVAWEGDTWPVEEGVSMQLDPEHLDSGDNDLPENWCPSTVPEQYMEEFGTPGEPNLACEPEL